MRSIVGSSARWLALAGLLVVVLADPGRVVAPALAAQGERSSTSRDGDAKAAAAEEGLDRPIDRGEATESFFEWMRDASGPIGVVILLLSFYLIALIIWMAIEYRRKNALPTLLTRELTDLLSQKRYNDAYQRLATDRSFLARVLAAGARKLSMGREAAVHASELANDDATMEMEHRTTYLATIGTLGPMIGLVGTVYGMIMSFRVMALEGASPRASQLAAGISTALFATLEGIAISIPAIFFHALFRNKIARLSLEVAIATEAFLDQFAPGTKASHPMGTVAFGLQRSQQPPGTSGNMSTHAALTSVPVITGDLTGSAEVDPPQI